LVGEKAIPARQLGRVAAAGNHTSFDRSHANLPVAGTLRKVISCFSATFRDTPRTVFLALRDGALADDHEQFLKNLAHVHDAGSGPTSRR
jgi:hypothetical protein